jgi:hypothetical protein
MLLVGDVLQRAVEAGGGRAAYDCVHPPEQSGALKYVMSALGIGPPSRFEGAADAHLFGDARRDGEEGVWIEVGRVRDTVSEPVETDGIDPLAIRVVLLDRPCRQPVSLTFGEVADADRMLRSWRVRVAQWAHAPSRPVPEVFRRRVADALADDLDTPAVLDVLRRVEASSEVPAGAKFETAAHLDRVLGLELTREVGRI